MKFSHVYLVILIGCKYFISSLGLFPHSIFKNPYDLENRNQDVRWSASHQLFDEMRRNPPNTLRWVRSTALRLHSWILPILHAFDECLSFDTCYNMHVLWWKAISGNDDGISYDLLPPFTRIIVSKPFRWLYPPFHHKIVEIRTKFLDKIFLKEVINVDCLPRAIVIGSGFDSRSLRLSRYAEWIELDLPQVIEQRKCMLQRFLSRRKKPKDFNIPRLISTDVNDLSKLKNDITSICSVDSEKIQNNQRKTIFILEGVLMYLKPSIAFGVIETCVQAACPYSSSVSICFADDFPYVPHTPRLSANDYKVEQEAVTSLLNGINMKLTEWATKRGHCRHMGLATFVK